MIQAPPQLASEPTGPDAKRRIRSELSTCLFPGGFMSKRKPLAETIEAFRATSDRRLRLRLKAQVDRQAEAGRADDQGRLAVRPA